MSTWNPEQYEHFRNERSKPFFDLLDMVTPIPGGRAIDLGCGTGELTKVMHERVGAKSTVGLDNSETMLERSREQVGRGLAFKLGTILRFRPRTPYDLVFSNAALQWVDEHESLFPKLAEAVAPGGQIAIQMPDNDTHVSHLVADALADEDPFLRVLGGPRTWPVLAPERYAEILDSLGFTDIEVVLRIYVHHLESRDSIVEWVKGTYLTYYKARLTEQEYEEFLKRYREGLYAALPDTRPVVYTYRRLLMHAVKAN